MTNVPEQAQSAVFSTAKAQALQKLLNDDPAFAERAAHVVAKLALVMGQESWTFSMHSGQVVRVQQGLAADGVDFTITGPVEEWALACSGQKHLIEAMNPHLGRLRLSGNIVLYAASNRSVFYLVSGLREVC